MIIFTDGACEEGEEGTSIGGVLFDVGGIVECFGARMSQRVIDSWKTREDQTQVIGQAEVFPVLVSRLTWHKRIAGRRAIYFVDNESARLALIKMYSPVLPTLDILMQITAWDFKEQSHPWYSRVPTYSNIADDPSRMCAKLLKESFKARVVVRVFPIGVVPIAILK